MIWLAWRQHRMTYIVIALCLAASAAFFWLNGLTMRHALAAIVDQGCSITDTNMTSACREALDGFRARFDLMRGMSFALLLAVPVLLGLFLGAPIFAREFEQRTHQLVWTQGVTRTRWLLAKLAFTIIPAVAVSALLALLVSWWRHPIDQFQAGQWDDFDLGPVLMAYAFFAVCFGLFIGGVIRRTMPAIAVTLGVFIAVRVPIIAWARARFLPPLHDQSAIVFNKAFGPAAPGSFEVSSSILDGNGNNVTPFEFQRFVDGWVQSHGERPGPDALTQAVASAGFVRSIFYQPESRYWLFQGIESAIFVALGLACLAAVIWWMTRKAEA